MDRDGLGLIGGIAADRPLLVVLLLALGLTALSVVGAAEMPTVGSYAAIANTLTAGILLVVVPLLLASATPRRFGVRLAAGVTFILAAIAATVLLAPAFTFRGVTIPVSAITGFAYLLIFLMLVGPAFGSSVRFAFIAAAAALLGGIAGLLLVGWLLDRDQSYAQVIGLVALAQVVVVFMVLSKFPETAHRELEDLNPEDDTVIDVDLSGPRGP